MNFNFNFNGHLIESHYRTEAAESRATYLASLGPLPKATWFSWLHRRSTAAAPVTLPAKRQSEPSSSCSAKAA